MDEWLIRALRWFARPLPPATRGADLSKIDQRLSLVEREQHEIEVRLHLLELQSDPRGLREQRGG